MKQQRIPAVFVRGGTSKGLLLHRVDLPDDRGRWDRIFLAALGSPDPYGRQLDGMGGGLSSLSKICVIGPPSRGDADVDYTFAQILIKEAHVDYTPLCGNMSSAVGPFAVDEGLVKPAGADAIIRIHNTNTLCRIRGAVRDIDCFVGGDDRGLRCGSGRARHLERPAASGIAARRIDVRGRRRKNHRQRGSRRDTPAAAPAG